MCRQCSNKGIERVFVNGDWELEDCQCGLEPVNFIKASYNDVMDARMLLSRNFMTMALSRVIYPFRKNMESI